MAAARKFWAEREGHSVISIKEANQAKPDTKRTPHDSGLSVGTVDSALVQELQDEVRSLTERVSTNSQRFADYENEIHDLRTQLKQERNKTTQNEAVAVAAAAAAAAAAATATITTPAVPQESTSPLATRPVTPNISRFGSFMRKPVTSPVDNPPTPRERELEQALTQEQGQRAVAEKKIRDMDSEIEELSSTLFQQANDMVSAERRENAALRDRIQMLEQHESKVSGRLRALEQREADRKRRMEKLEGAVLRIERAKSLLLPR